MEQQQLHKYLSMPVSKPAVPPRPFMLLPHPPRRIRPSLFARLVPSWPRRNNGHR